MKFQIIIRTRAGFLSSTAVGRQAQRIIAKLKPLLKKSNKSGLRNLNQANAITLVFTGTKEMKNLNHRFRGKNQTTDILSFSPVEAHSLGELVFCVPVVKKQSQEHGLSLNQEFTYLLIHGILHLLDYDHERNDRAARRMYRLQDEIFEKLSK